MFDDKIIYVTTNELRMGKRKIVYLGDSDGVAERVMSEGDFDYYQISREEGKIFLESYVKTKLKGEVSFAEFQRPHVVVDKTLAYILFELTKGKFDVKEIIERVNILEEPI